MNSGRGLGYKPPKEKAKRIALSKKVRFDIFKRDGFACQYCGAAPPSATLHVDHIIPVVEGGKNDADNLVTACDGCNLGKGAGSLESIPASLAERAAAVSEREEQLRGYSKVMSDQRVRLDRDTWLAADIFVDHFKCEGIRKDWFQSVRQFVEKIGCHECVRAMEIAVSRMPWSKDKAFRYFCGICWNVIREANL